MKMMNIAPGLHRRFSAEEFDFLPFDIWKKAREEAKGKEQRNVVFEVFASDIDESCLAIARENAERAGVLDKMKIFKQDARQITKLDRRATILCNPPYGERLLDTEQAEKLYREIGKNFNTLYPWQIYILSSCDRFERFYGRRADKVKKYYNGTIPCFLYQFYKPQEARPNVRSDKGKSDNHKQKFKSK